jgi:hypothetical protein
MKYGFRNGRGIQALSRQKYINDNIVPLQLDYIGFQETKKQQFSNTYLKCVLGNNFFAWNHLPSVGSIGGIFSRY